MSKRNVEIYFNVRFFQCLCVRPTDTKVTHNYTNSTPWNTLSSNGPYWAGQPNINQMHSTYNSLICLWLQVLRSAAGHAPEATKLRDEFEQREQESRGQRLHAQEELHRAARPAAAQEPDAAAAAAVTAPWSVRSDQQQPFVRQRRHAVAKASPRDASDAERWETLARESDQML